VEGAASIIITTDPITGELQHDLDTKSFVVKGKGNLAVKIYFESEETRRTYLPTHDSPVNATDQYSHWALVVLPHPVSGSICQKSNTT